MSAMLVMSKNHALQEIQQQTRVAGFKLIARH